MRSNKFVSRNKKMDAAMCLFCFRCLSGTAPSPFSRPFQTANDSSRTERDLSGSIDSKGRFIDFPGVGRVLDIDSGDRLFNETVVLRLMVT